MMIRMYRYIGCGLLLWLVAAPGWADETDEGGVLDGVAIEVVGDPDADETDYVDEISLPEIAPPPAKENAQFGLDTANDARDNAAGQRREFGQSIANEARERGRDAGNAAKPNQGAGNGKPEGLPPQAQ